MAAEPIRFPNTASPSASPPAHRSVRPRPTALPPAPAYRGARPAPAGESAHRLARSAVRPVVRPRQKRTRRVEASIVFLAVLALAWTARAAWIPRAAGPGEDGRVSSAPLAGSAEGAATAAAALPGMALGPAGHVAVQAARAAITFSFAKFEADPALVVGAISTGVPNLSGDSAIVVDLSSKEVLYAKQPRKRQLMASTAKIMTAIVAVERSGMDKVVAVPLESTQVEPNHMGIRVGERLTVQELLYGLLLDSGNDAGEALAYGVGGGGATGRAQFVAWMNETTAALGLRDTRFANPSGLDDPEQYSTAYDLSVIGAYALTKPELRRVFAMRDVVIESSREPGREHGWFRPGNLNSLLSSYRGAIGIKPGYTEDAGYTLVGAAERDGRTLVCVTLSSRRHFSDCSALLDFGFTRAALQPTPLPTPY